MAATNLDHNMYYMQFPVNGPNYNVNSCKIEVSHPQERHFPMVVSPHQNKAETHKVLISNNTYYGHHQLEFSSAAANEEIRPMDCEMMPISSPHTPEISFGRKRSGRDVSFANIKRLKQEVSDSEVERLFLTVLLLERAIWKRDENRAEKYLSNTTGPDEELQNRLLC